MNRKETMKLTIYAFIALLFFLPQLTFAQEDYSKWLKEQENEYNKFVSEQDKEFIGFLKKNWVSVRVDEGTRPFQSPELPRPVIFSPGKRSGPPVESPVKQPPSGKTEVKSQPPAAHPTPPANVPRAEGEQEQNAASPAAGAKSFSLDFFGRAVSVPESDSLDVPFTGKVSNDAVARYWEKLCRTDYKVVLDRAGAIRNELKLNDWGYCKLLYEVASRIDNGRRNEACLLTWFMLVKSGYAARIGYRGDRIYLLILTGNELYDVPFFRFGNGGVRYYVLLLDETEKEPTGALLTYTGSYPQDSRRIDFGFGSLPELGNALAKTTLSGDYKGKAYSFHVEYNSDLIKYYRYYPTTDLHVYFASNMSQPARSTLLPDLKSAIKGMNQTEAVGFLLHFVQFATGYKTDPQQFGHQKFFFPDENLHYKYTDCADRAIFFSYLVKTLLGLRVIGLEYPDHLSAAVRFTTEVSGDYVTYDGSKYIICDPTYIGAPIGQAMPKYLHAAATIVN